MNPGRFRWVALGFAFSATVINYLNRQTLSVLAPSLQARWHITDQQYGWIVATFLGAYALANVLSGPLIDRLGSRVGYGVFVLWWSLAGIAHIWAKGAWSLAVYRFFLGVGEAGNWPAATKVVTEWFPARERSLAAGIFNTGASFGALVAPLLVAWTAGSLGWQAAFVLVGALGVVWTALWLCYYRAPAPKNDQASRGKRPSVRALVRTRFLRVFALSKVLIDPVWYFYIFWIPKYLAANFGYTLAEIGKMAWIPFVTADAGNFCGGLLTTCLLRAGVSVPTGRKLGACLFGMLMAAGGFVPLTHSPSAAIALISVATFGYTGYTANSIAFPGDVFPSESVASVWGFASLGSGLGGMLFAWLTGLVIEHWGYAWVFMAYGTMPLIGLALIVWALGPLARDRDFLGDDRPVGSPV